MRTKKRVLCSEIIVSVLGPRGLTARQIRNVEKILEENLRLLLADIKKVKPQAKEFTFRIIR